LLANPPPEPAEDGEEDGRMREEEEEEGREVVPLSREVVAQVVDAVFDRWAGAWGSV